MAPDEVVAAIRAGRKVEAIRLLRLASGMGLAEAKAMVEQIERQMPGRHAPAKASRPEPHLSPGEVPRRGAGKWLAVLAIAVAAVAYAIFSR